MLLGGPDTGQMDESVCVVLVVHRENTKLVPNFTLHSMLIMQPYQYQRQRSTAVHSCLRLTTMQPSTYKTTARPQIIRDLNVFLQLRTQDSPNPINSPSSFHKVPTCLQTTFTRNMSGYFLITVISVKIYFLSNICSV